MHNLDIANIKTEIYIPVKGLEGFIDVSTDGNLKSVSSGKILALKTDLRGYHYYSNKIEFARLGYKGNYNTIDGTLKNKLYVHIAVADAFIPPPLEIQPGSENVPIYVVHNNYDLTDNSLYNIALKHYYSTKNKFPITISVLVGVLKDYNSGDYTISELADKYKMDSLEVYAIVNPKPRPQKYTKIKKSRAYLKLAKKECVL